MRYNVRTRLYLGYIVIFIVFGVAPSVVLPWLGWSKKPAIGLYGAMLALGGLAGLLLTYLELAALRRLLGQVNAGLANVHEGRFLPIDRSIAPPELAPLIASYNVTIASLDTRERALREQIRRTALLTRLSFELRETLDPEAIVRGILSAIVTNSDASGASVFLIGPDGAVDLGVEIQAGELRPVAPERARRVVERGLAGWVLRNDRHVVVGDVGHDERWLAFGDRRSGSALLAPIKHGRAILGALTITHPARDHFTSADLLLLEGVAAQTGVALNAAYRHLEEQRYREHAFLLFSATQFLTAERSAGDMARALLEKSDTIFDASYMGLYLTDHTTKQLALFATHGALPAVAGGVQAAGETIDSVVARVLADQSVVTSPLAGAASIASERADSAADIPAGQTGDPMCVGLPLLHNGDSIGALLLVRQGRDGGVFPARVWSMLTTFTNVIAAAFANIQLLDRLRGRAEELERLVDERTIQLQRSRDLLRIIFDNLPDGLVLTDADSRVLAANNAFCQGVLGMRPRMVIGQIYREIIAEAERSSCSRIEAKIGIHGSQRVRCTDVAGQERWFQVAQYVTVGAAGAQQTIEHWRDVTQHEELHRELLQQQELTSLGQLAASVVHEVGNPVQGIRTCLDLCREDAGITTTTADYLLMADEELLRIGGLLERLRNLYRLPTA